MGVVLKYTLALNIVVFRDEEPSVPTLSPARQTPARPGAGNAHT